MTRLVLDAGAFVAYERGERLVRLHVEAARRLSFELATTSPVVAQVWRDGRRQVLLQKLLLGTRIDAPDEASARRAGALLAKTRTSDVVDALLVGLARAGDTIVTSDPEDIQALLDAARISAAIAEV